MHKFLFRGNFFRTSRLPPTPSNPPPPPQEGFKKNVSPQKLNKMKQTVFTNKFLRYFCIIPRYKIEDYSTQFYLGIFRIDAKKMEKKWKK